MEEKEHIKKSTKKTDSFFKSFMGFLNGNALQKEEALTFLPYMLFLVGVALIYIVNGFWAENSIRAINKSTIALKEMRSEYITTKSDLMYICKQSEIAEIINKKGLGLKESYTPPNKIVITPEDKAALK